MKTQKQYIRAARQDNFYMPNTQRQGWGRTIGTQTTVIEVIDADGNRTIYRTNDILTYTRRVENDMGVVEASECVQKGLLNTI